MPIIISVQTPEPLEPARPPAARALGGAARLQRSGASGVWAAGGPLTLLAGLVLALSPFMGWYSAREADDLTLAVIGWHTGTLGKLVFFVGLAVLALVALREAGFELPARVPESLVVIALGSLATIFVLISLISVPDEFFGRGRGVGIWISLVAALAVIVAGLLRAGEEL